MEEGRARGGGGCVSIPEVIALRDALALLPHEQRAAFQPRLDSINLLMDEYNKASAPSITDNVRKEILGKVKTEEVKAIVLPILQDLFDGTLSDRTRAKMIHILNCILDALTNDLPLTTLIPMVCMMFITVFYNDDPLRMALGAAFVGSVGYLTWVGGMNHIFGLGRESVIIILSAMAQCAHITEDALYSETLKNLLGPTLVGSIGGSIYYLLPSAGGIFAMSNVCLMNWIYGRANFPAGDELLRAEAARAAGGGVAQAPLQSGVLPVNPAAAPRPAAAAVPGNSVFRQMYHELQGAAVVVGTHAKNHLVTLGGLARRIKDTRPGQLGGENRLYNLANVFFQACVSKTFTVFNEQARLGGQRAVEVSAKHLLSACLPSEIRTGGELEAREEIFLLAHRIKSNVIDCLVKNQPRITREDATSDLEEAFPVFVSHLTVDNVERLNSGQLNTILQMLLKFAETHEFKAAETHEFPGEEQPRGDDMGQGDGPGPDSQTPGPPSTPLHVRLASIKDDLMKLLHLDRSVPRTPEEETELKKWVKENIGAIGHIIGIFDVSIGWVAQKARNSKFLQCSAQTVSGFAAEAKHKMSAGVAAKHAEIFKKYPDLRRNLPAIELFLTAPWRHVLNEIRTSQATGTSYDTIIDMLREKYKIKGESAGFKAYIEALMLRVDLEFIINRGGECSVQPNIVAFNKKDGTSYEAPVLTLSLPDGFYVNDKGVVVKTIDLNIEVLERPINVPGGVSELLTKAKNEAKKKSNEWFTWGTDMCGKFKMPEFDFVVRSPPSLPPSSNLTDLPSLEQQQQHISECCAKAPEILSDLLVAREIVGAINEIDPVQLASVSDDEAADALLEGSVKFTSVEQNDAHHDSMQQTQKGDVTQPTGSSSETVRFSSVEQNPAHADPMPQTEERVVTQPTGSTLDRPLSRAARAKMTKAAEAAKARVAEAAGRTRPEDWLGGKSSTRRRLPATAKRTRRKAYNKKSNKRKSRKQISRRRQSRRK